jgi:hypothetical protein
MNLRSAFAGATGIALLVACGSTYKLGDGNQPSDGAGGADGGSVGGGGTVNQGGGYAAPGGSVGVAGDPSVGGDPGIGGGSYGGDPGIGGGSYGGDPGAGGVAYGGAYGGPYGGHVSAGGVAYGGNPGFGAYGGGTVGGGGVAYGGSPGCGGTGGDVGAGGQAVTMPLDQGPYHPSTPGIGVGGALNADVAGSWVGYIENFAFPSTSDAVTMTISQGAQTGLVGHVAVGQGSGVLPDLSAIIAAGNGGEYDVLTTPVEGFSYTMMNGQVSGSRLVFDIAPAEAWGSVCSAQTPFPGTHTCASTGWGAPDSSGKCLTTLNCQDYLIDCAALFTCSYACRCDDTHCFFDSSANLVHFDVAYRSPYLDGSVAGLPGNPVFNVHFSPQ